MKERWDRTISLFLFSTERFRQSLHQCAILSNVASMYEYCYKDPDGELSEMNLYQGPLTTGEAKCQKTPTTLVNEAKLHVLEL